MVVVHRPYLRVEMGQPALPDLDDALRRRMVARYGSEVEVWLDELPPVLAALARRWQLELGSLIPHGHMSVVIRCRTADRSPGVLKVCYDRARLASEAAALRRWDTPHVPSVLAVDASVGALLIEAIVPGTMFLESPTFPVPDVARLLTALHTRACPIVPIRPSSGVSRTCSSPGRGIAHGSRSSSRSSHQTCSSGASSWHPASPGGPRPRPSSTAT
jgi:Aminoglycoside/hydroxyurea antibiotic resistance kinase